MNKSKFVHENGYRLIDQMVATKMKYPQSNVYIKRGTLHWSGYLRPTVVSRTYHVVVLYKMKKRPIVKLIGNDLKGLDKQELPHKFGVDREKGQVDLCLHLSREFNSGMLIADTIIPWAIEWLFFYEIWLTTNVWCGGGRHPDIKHATSKE